MANYSALILFITLAVFWSSAEARYNHYQKDVIDAMTNWGIEEMRDLPEPYKTRIEQKLRDAQGKHWNNIGEYFKFVQKTLAEFVSEVLRSKRQAHYEDSSDFSDTAEYPYNSDLFESIKRLKRTEDGIEW